MVDRHCTKCDLPFRRTESFSLKGLDINTCFDCYTFRLVGKNCDTLIRPMGGQLIGMRGTAEKFTVVAHEAPYTYWYALTPLNRLEILNSPVEFRSVEGFRA